MTARLVALAWLAAGVSFGQLQLYRIPGPGLEEPFKDQYDAGSVPAGDFRDTRLRIRNLGDAAITLERLRVTGVGFSLEGHPSVPYIIAPRTNVDFRVRFQPPAYGSYSGSLRINDAYYLFLGTSPPTLTVSVEAGGGFRLLRAGETIVFGRAEGGSSIYLRFRIENPSSDVLTARSVVVSGGPFRLDGAPATPITLNPREMVVFGVYFEPLTAGIYLGQLAVDERTFVLDGVGLHPPFPAPELNFDRQTYRSGQQGRISVRLAGASAFSGTGEVGIAFQPAIEGATDDPAVQFLLNSSRSVPLSVKAGESAALFGGNSEAVFQTGTTAGLIVFTVRLGTHVKEATVTLPPEPVAIDSGRYNRIATGIELKIAGFDNSQSASQVAFQFFDVKGRPLASEPIRVTVEKPFREYFRNNRVGGMFSLLASFPVAGDPSLLGSVDVELTNQVGPSAKHTIKLQ